MSEPQQPSAQPDGQPMPPAPPAPPAAPHGQHPPMPPYAQSYGQPSAQPAQPGRPYGQPPAQSYGQAPAQPYGQHSQPGQPNGQAPYGGQGPASGGAGNSLGRIAFVISAVAFGIGLVVSAMIPFLYRGGDFTLTNMVHGVLGFILFAGHAAALILALLALRRPGSNLFAAIALGISGSALIAQIIGWISPLFWGLI